jgi:arsenate reductase (thioredoxin)
MSKLKVLFLCTGNACRSQMAEGWAKALKPDVIEAYSAGTSPHGLDPRSVAVMAEAGVDISSQQPKAMADLLHIPFDVVITVCDRAVEACPLFLGKARIIHHGFQDPPKLAQGLPEYEALKPYRQVRDEIKAFINTLPQAVTM